ncbi:Uncharacterised protein [uncultured archaeon]|nr:Uncharacterised protein [uncultured archaeon]
MWLKAVANPALAFEDEARRSRSAAEWLFEAFYHFLVVCLAASAVLVVISLADFRLVSGFGFHDSSGLSFLLIAPVAVSVIIVFFALLALGCMTLSGSLLGGNGDLLKLSYFYSICLPFLVFILPGLYHLILGLAGIGPFEFYYAAAGFLVGSWGLFMLTHAIRVSFGLSLMRSFLVWSVPLLLVGGMLVWAGVHFAATLSH